MLFGLLFRENLSVPLASRVDPACSQVQILKLKSLIHFELLFALGERDLLSLNSAEFQFPHSIC